MHALVLAALIDTLHGAGSPVFVTSGDAGLYARSADGKVGTQLAPGPIGQAILDGTHDLVWFTSKGSLEVIDLRADVATPVVIATGVPDNVDLRVAWSGAGDDVVLSSHAELAVNMGKKPKLTAAVVKGVDWDWWYKGQDSAKTLAQLAKKAKKAKLVGGKWLRAQAARTARGSEPPPPAWSDKVALPAQLIADRCDGDTDTCGSATPFAGKYQLVYSSYSCGDFCYEECLIYDPAKKLFAVPPDTTTWTPIDKVGDPGPCGNYRVEQGGAMFLADDQLCMIGGTCTALTEHAIGWLDPGTSFLLPDVRGPQ